MEIKCNDCKYLQKRDNDGIRDKYEYAYCDKLKYPIESFGVVDTRIFNCSLAETKEK